MREEIVEAIAEASGLEKEAVSRTLVRTQDLAHGDFAFPCFVLGKEWKIPPHECAMKLRGSLVLPEGVTRVESVGPYLNFFLERSALSRKVVGRILAAGFELGRGSHPAETVIIEYSSPNIAKPLHLGHLRNISIGHSLDLIYRHLGYQVITIDHLGDWGTQFGFVYAGCELWGRPENPTIESLVGLYVRATALRKAQEESKVPPEDADKPDVNQMARDYFVRLEAGEESAETFWKWCRDISLDYFETVYSRLGVKFDHHLGESFYRSHLPGIEQWIRESGVLEESRGALGVNLGKELGFVRIFAEDGRSLYITRDMASERYRWDTFKPARILHVVGGEQRLYFRQFIEVMRRLGHPVADGMVHVWYGYVPGMKTRAGNVIGLRDFLDEAHERALTAYREEVTKRPEGLDEEEIAEKVGIGATAFYFLSHSKEKDFNFSWREALNFQGDSGPYVQYALARLNSILARASEAGLEVRPDFNPEILKDDQAHALVSLLERFEEVLYKAVEENEPFNVAAFALDIARAFSSGYKILRVVGEEPETAHARLALFAATRYVLHVALTLIGVPPVERM